MNITFIGSGNVAEVLGYFFHEAGHNILEIISPDKNHARQVAEKYSAIWSDDIQSVDPQADLVIIAVKDSAIQAVNQALRLDNQLVVHTAGGVPMDAIAAISSRIGVLYPLQTMNKAIRPSPFPLLLETNDRSCRSRLEAIARSISDRVEWMDSDKRLKIHVAGVFCNNFVNRLAVLAENFCRSESLDFSLLTPLLEETLQRIKAGKAEQDQTGPARRGDTGTLAAHEKTLEQYPEMKYIYRQFSEQIRIWYQNKD